MEDFPRLAAEGAGYHAAYLSNVPDAHRKAQELAFDEERLEERVLRTMQSSPVGVIVKNNVAFFERLKRNFLGASLDEQRHTANHRRAEFGAGDHIAFGVSE